jgi:hypothetical protein
MARKRLQNHHAKNAGFDRINTAVFKQSAFVKYTIPDMAYDSAILPQIILNRFKTETKVA